LSQIELQNQDGIRASFGQIFGGRTSVIVFFYTRCMNPDKCSRTISKLARVHRLIGQNLADSTGHTTAIAEAIKTLAVAMSRRLERNSRHPRRDRTSS
jgi:cytochrome oxidase Cu insertion factor (SCO1/SenC/PrrC family)